jgi:hypothetical protein
MAKFLFRITVLVAALAGLLVFFLAVVRPWYLRWGATTVETARALPGDDIVGPDAGQETRAITIGAPIDVVWPWLAQLGQDRGGFYSFDVLENLVGCQMPTIDVLRPDHQNWSVGDRLWMYPPNRADGVGFATLRAYVPGRAMGFGTHMTGTSMDAPDNGSWSFVLEPLGPATTRLLVRGRGTSARSLLASGFDRSIFEPVHFAMERRMMIGLKEIAETGSRHRLRNHAHVLLWTFSFGLMLVAASRVLLGRRWKASLGGFVMAAALFQVLTLVQPALWVGVPLTLLVWLAFANGHVLRG